jgi:diguanylate cyclase (GGDEF)-like protein
MNEQLVKKIKQCPSLPSLPAIALQVLELAQKEQVDIAEIARIISKDPALSSKILRTVNSSFYGRSQSISTISHALVILGLQSVKTLVLGFSLVTNLSKLKARGFKHLVYWRRSVYAATAARTLAHKLQLVQQEECFLAALLMDIGMLVLDQVMGDAYGELHETVATHQRLCEAEAASLGMTHADVSGILAEQWRLPPLLAIPMALHHRPGEVTDVSLQKLSDIVSVAGRCADIFVDTDAAESIAFVRQHCLTQYGIAEADCDAMLDEICKRTKEIAPLFEISIATGTNYDGILKKANEALVELTLRTQQQAATLLQQNKSLKVQATTDALTGLANRATMDACIGEAFAAALASAKPISLLMIDVDNFKAINDKFGHPIGDQVLKTLGRLLKAAGRSQDISARYGGEEMCLIMPATPKATAAAMAESLRRAVCTRPFGCDGAAQVPVSISIGVATLEPGMPFTLAAHLVKAADLALYAAKHSGKNCVKVFAFKPPAAKAPASSTPAPTTPAPTTPAPTTPAPAAAAV